MKTGRKTIPCIFLSLFIDIPANAGPISQAGLKTGAEVYVRPKMKDPSSAVFTGLHGVSIGGVDFFCGYVNAKNSFGGYAGTVRFAGVVKDVFSAEVAFEQQTSRKAFAKLWAACDGKLEASAKKAER